VASEGVAAEGVACDGVASEVRLLKAWPVMARPVKA
jgi:hypothetical protein